MKRNSAIRWMLVACGMLGLGACSDDPTSARTADPSVTPSAASAADTVGQRRWIPDQYVVVFKYDQVGNVPALVNTLVTAPGDSVLYVYQHALRGFAARLSPASLEAIRKHPLVDYVTQDERGTADQSAGTWGLDRIDQRSLPLDGVYAPNRDGTGVNIYIIDSGIRKSHQEFDWGARALHGYSAINDEYGSSDCNGHGTHVAATAGGTNYGVAKKATLYAVRITDCYGNATVSALISGVDWVTANRILPAVANLSYSRSARSDIDDAVERTINAGVTFVTSAGNDDADACNYSPNRKSNVLTVGASRSDDWRRFSSNWGPCVKIFAPGEDILSAWNGSDTDTWTFSGTSFSSPHVAGIAALYLQGDPGAPPWKVQDAVMNSATKDAILDPKGSNNRLAYAFPVYFGVTISGPASISSTGYHTWEAMPEGGDGSYTYQWSVHYFKTGYTETLGTGKTQTLYVTQGNGDFNMQLTASSAGQTKNSSLYVSNGGTCDPSDPNCAT